MKVCNRCGRSLPLDMFYFRKSIQMYLGPCKDCTLLYNRQRKKKIREKLHAYEVTRRAYHREKSRKWKSRYPERRKAHSLVQGAIRKGLLTRPDRCDRCGQTHELIEAHHHDYSKPLDVEWLCPHCHARAHGRVKDLSHIEALQKQRGYM